jgi:mannose-6-phosphate isomerase-like protein (cupin superfamily)
MKTRILIVTWLIGFVAVAVAGEGSALTSKVIGWDKAKSHVADWGEMRTYFTGKTFGTTNMFTAMAVVKPGQSVHPAHRHAEEEFLVLTKGSGTWRLDGKEFPAKEGDVLYIEPWKFHGLVNTSKEPLTFFVVRWNNQGVAPPAAPAGDHGK